jgi:hypothetical protein
MNQHIKIFLAVLLTTFSVGCKDLLEEENRAGLTGEIVFNDPAGYESLVNASYAYLRAWYGKEEGYNLTEMGSDLWYPGVDNRRLDLMVYNNLQGSEAGLASTEVFLERLWQRSYQAINLVNTGIKQVGESGLSVALQTTREAELRFLRAHYYWLLTEQWGDVHFTTEPTVGVETTANRTPKAEIYKQIDADLTFAVANLPATTTQYGRATRSIAEAFFARVLLFEGKYAEASALAQKVIADGGYTLQAKFADLWSMSNLKNKEVIWACNYTSDLTLSDLTNVVTNPDGHPRGGNNGHLHFAMAYERTATGSIGMSRDLANGRPFVRYMPTSHLLDLYNETVDARYNATFKQVWICNKAGAYKKKVGATEYTVNLAVGDTAILATKYDIPDAVDSTKKYLIIDRSKMYKSDGSFNGNAMYVPLKKFDDPTRPTFNEAQSARDVYIIRLAEMYLIAAEAEMNLGNNAKAAELINVVRKRAAVPGKETQMEITAADINIDFILDERAREFAGEQLRWFDLKRTGKLLERVKLYNKAASALIQDFHVLRPIPQKQLDAVTNKSEFVQNPGYK